MACSAVDIDILNFQKRNQCLKGHKSLGLLFYVLSYFHNHCDCLCLSNVFVTHGLVKLLSVAHIHVSDAFRI